jgi:hypothetical protein
MFFTCLCPIIILPLRERLSRGKKAIERERGTARARIDYWEEAECAGIE